MISGGAAFTFAILALLAGVVIGSLLPRRVDDTTDAETGPEWGKISRAAADAYRGAHHEAIIGHEANVRETDRWGAWQPRMLVSCDAVPIGRPELVDGEGFRALAGVDLATVLRALERAAADPRVWL